MLSKDYTQFIHRLNLENKSSSKEFFIILKYNSENVQKEFLNQTEELATNNLSEQYFKIKETLSRCGNIVQALNSKKEVEEFLLNFYIKN
jgi:membrane-anchored protein YejM (alkaline phosphatase superfamily)